MDLPISHRNVYRSNFSSHVPIDTCIHLNPLLCSRPQEGLNGVSLPPKTKNFDMSVPGYHDKGWPELMAVNTVAATTYDGYPTFTACPF